MTTTQHMACKLSCAKLPIQCCCRVFYEGILPFKPTAYGMHNVMKRNSLLVARAKVSLTSSSRKGEKTEEKKGKDYALGFL